MGVSHTLSLLIFVLFVASGRAAQKEVSNAVPRGWTPSVFHKREYLGEHEIKVSVALSQRNIDQLESVFWAVSDPKNVNYGRYKSFDEVVDMVAPSQAAINQVTQYFTEMGVQSGNIQLHTSRDFMTVSMTVSQAEKIFQTVYEPFVHSKTGDVAVGMRDTYVLEEKIYPHVDFVSRFSRIPALHGSAAAVKAAEKGPRGIMAVNSNAPYVRLPWADFAGFSVRLILVCPDGSAPTITGVFGSYLICNGVNITTITVSGVSHLSQNILFARSLNISTLSIDVCSNYNESCLPIAQANGIPVDAAYLGIDIETTNVPLYVPYTLQFAVVYSDGNTSATTESSAIEQSDIVTPDFAHALYSVKSSPVVTSAKNIQGVVQFEGQSYSPADLQYFFQRYQIPDYSGKVQVVNPQNNNQTDPGGEASLDIQTIMGIAQNATTVFWANTNTGSTIDDHLTWITDVLNQPTAPLLFSISYGNSEGKDYAPDVVIRTNNEFMKAGARGITLLYSSGDSGAGGATFDPAFPASSPYVTAVGGTQLTARIDPSCFTGDNYTCTPEEVVSSVGTGSGFTSGGGFSNIFPRPSYQDAVVTPYLPSLQGLTFNSSNRAYPDISTIGHNAPIFFQGKFELEDGTSASAPFFAGLVTLLNDLRLQYGNAPLGFLNPFIYSLNASAFNDVVRGDNNCTEIQCFSVGYNAQPGYDAASGRGTPRFDQWAAAVLALPPTNTTTPTSAPTTPPSPPTTAPSHTSGAPQTAWLPIFATLVFAVLCTLL